MNHCFENIIFLRGSYLIFRELIIFFGNMILCVRKYYLFQESKLFASKIWFFICNIIYSKKVNYVLRKYVRSSENIIFSNKVDCLLRKYDLSFDNIICSKEVNYLLRKSRLEATRSSRKLTICFENMTWKYYFFLEN